MRIVCKNIKEAKEKLAHIKGLGLVVGETHANGDWVRKRTQISETVLLEDQPTLRKWGRTKIHAMVDPEFGSEDFTEIPGKSEIVIYYREALDTEADDD